MDQKNLFKWRHFESDIIILCVRWYLRYALSYRDLEEMMLERGLMIAHSTICRWVHKYSPELDKRCRRHLKPTNDSYRVDETHIKVKGRWTYLYRAVDSMGNTIEFMLSENRDAKSAERFFEKAFKSPHSIDPRVINIDNNAAYPPAMDSLKQGGQVDRSCKLRQIKYLNNIVEQDHRFIKRRVGPGLGFDSFRTADMTLRGYEAMNMIRKGQVEGVGKEDITGQVKFIESLFGTAA